MPSTGSTQTVLPYRIPYNSGLQLIQLPWSAIRSCRDLMRSWNADRGFIASRYCPKWVKTRRWANVRLTPISRLTNFEEYQADRSQNKMLNHVADWLEYYRCLARFIMASCTASIPRSTISLTSAAWVCKACTTSRSFDVWITRMPSSVILLWVEAG